MFKLIKELWGSLKEGINEGIQEAKKEKHESDAIKDKLINSPLDLEKSAIALACPFREILINSGTKNFRPHLYRFGYLTDKEKESLRGLLIRDFAIMDGETAQKAIRNLIGPWAIEKDSETEKEAKLLKPLRTAEFITFSCSTALYLLTSAIELGYTGSKDNEEMTETLVDKILSMDLGSWENFGKAFMTGEKIIGINSVAGRKFFKMGVNRLLADEASPWVTIPWENLGQYEKLKSK